MRKENEFRGSIKNNFVLIFIFFLTTFLTVFIASGPLDGKEVGNQQEKDFNLEKPENVIMIDIDTLRADHTGLYGYKRNTTPNIDRFAKNNIKFKNAFTVGTWTRPAQTSVFTSSYPRTHQTTQQRKYIPSEYTLLAEVMNERGYKTAAFTGGGSMRKGIGFEPGFDKYEIHSDYPNHHRRNFNANFREASKWISNRTGEKSFLFIHGYDVHPPFKARKPFIKEFDENYTGPLREKERIYLDDLSYRSGNTILSLEDRKINLTQEDIEHIRARYDSDVKYTDKMFGNFIEKLKEDGIYEDSAIILYSSHGENLGNKVHQFRGERYNFGHWYLWDHNMKVPLIMKLPGTNPKIVEKPVTTMDIAPSIYDLLDFKLSNRTYNQIQGESLLPALNEKYERDYVFTQNNPFSDTMVRGKRWKLINRKNGREDLLYSVGNGSEIKVSKNENAIVYQRLLSLSKKWENKTPKSLEKELETPKNNREKSLTSYITSKLSKLIKNKEKLPVSSLLEEKGILIEETDYQVENVENESLSDFERITVEAARDNSKMNIELFVGTKQKFAYNFIEDQKENVRTLYRKTYSSGLDQRKCESDYQPKIKEFNNSKTILTNINLYATKEKAMGRAKKIHTINHR